MFGFEIKMELNENGLRWGSDVSSLLTMRNRFRKIGREVTERGGRAFALLLRWVLVSMASIASAEKVSYGRDVLPILSENCYSCHGPDASSRKADLRLDLREAALADLEGTRAIVPGKPDESELLVRITAEVESRRMPPKKTGKTLTPAQIETLRAWIEQGAEWGSHWAFVPPEKPALPVVDNFGWIRGPMDTFVLARIESEGLKPSPPADPLTLLRRLSLDLTGLPPTLQDMEKFNSAPDFNTAYGEAVDRLLASPHFGERWARIWLDAAQYADSDGFEKDKPRQVWAWRDWVIRAFNSNMPYDQFLQQQIAGDLLPGAGRDQIVATGFLRNSMINEEGGIDPEQFRMEAMFNRMDVIGRAALGLTIQCAQCHDHKYDPLKQAEYYRLLAYINNSHEACVTVLSDDEEDQKAKILSKIEAMESDFKNANPDWQTRFMAWQEKVAKQPRPFWRELDLKFDDTTSGGQKFLPLGDASYLAAGYAPTRFSPKMVADSPLTTITAVRLEVLADPNLPRGGPGRSVYGTLALTEFLMYSGASDETIEAMDRWDKVPMGSAVADVNPARKRLAPEFSEGGKREAYTGPIEMALDGDGKTAWTTDNGASRRNQSRFAIFNLAQPLTTTAKPRIGIRLSQNHGGSNSDNNENINVGRFRISVTDATALPTMVAPDEILKIIARPASLRHADEATALFRYWMESQKDYPLAKQMLESAWQSMPSGTTQLVYREREDQRETHRLDRGDFLKPAERVEMGTPDWLNPMPEHLPPNRLALAVWLTDPRAPTTARAFVNRVWQAYFGAGLVETPSDFGLQGARPSHPELLDWLAVNFVESGWDIKALSRLIVTSATYRQSSRVTPELLEKDPKNRLLARGARFRVDGELVRDITLAASGLLSPKVGGPSVYPPAPEFLFTPPASYGPKEWKTATGEDRYRRGLYTFRFRSVPFPSLQVFDTPDGSAPCVRRERSNTPLQALTVLNEPLFVECAKSLAKLTMEKGGTTDADRIAWAFKRCAARSPNPKDSETLLAYLQQQRARAANAELKPSDLLGGTDDPEWAAWMLTARVMLSMDETMTRQ